VFPRNVGSYKNDTVSSYPRRQQAFFIVIAVKISNLKKLGVNSLGNRYPAAAGEDVVVDTSVLVYAIVTCKV
jgi:hypothetical protein